MSRVTLPFPAGWIGDPAIQTPGTGGGIQAKKVIHWFPFEAMLAAPAVTVTAVTEHLHFVVGSYASVTDFQAYVVTPPTTGSTYTVTVDLQRIRAGVAVSLLSSTIVIDDTAAALTAIQATLNTAYTGLQPGDILEAIATPAGSGSGAQALGLFVRGSLEESRT